MASIPRCVPVIRELPLLDPDEDAQEDCEDESDAQQLICTLSIPNRSRHDSYR